MCYNCGCGMPGDDHGDKRNITTQTFKQAATASKQSEQEAKKNTDQLLQKEI